MMNACQLKGSGHIHFSAEGKGHRFLSWVHGTTDVTLSYMNNYIVWSHRDVIVITKFAIIKYVIRRASKAQSIVMY